MSRRRERVINRSAHPMRLRFIYETGIAAGLAFAIFFATPFFIDASSDPDPSKDSEFKLSIVKAQIEKIGRFTDDRILECSGIVPSFRNIDCYWVHNDSGNAAEIYLVDKSGKTKLTVVLDGVKNVDFEDIAIAHPKDSAETSLIIGDIGDNLTRRKNLSLYILKEPKLDSRANITIRPDITIEFEFEGGEKHNCEGLAYDAIGNRIFVANKLSAKQILQSKEAALFAFDADFKTKNQKRVAKRIGMVPGQMVTGFDISLDGKALVLQNYLAGYFLPITGTLEESISKNTYTMFSLPVQRQSESICFTLDRKRLITASEGKKVSIYSIEVPKPAQ